MPTISRPTVVENFLQSASVDSDMIWDSLEVTKTATMSHGTLLLANGTEAADADITAGNAVYVIDDLLIADAVVGDVYTTRVVKSLDWVKFKASTLKVGATALTPAQLTAFGKQYA